MKTLIQIVLLIIFVISTLLLAFSLQGHEWNLVSIYGVLSIVMVILMRLNDRPTKLNLNN